MPQKRSQNGPYRPPDYPDQRAQLQTPDNRQAAINQKVTRTTLKTSKTEPKATQEYQLFWFLLRNGNRVNRLAASHQHYAPPVQVRIRHKRCPVLPTAKLQGGI
jgi:hypothetical protein